MPHNEKVMPSGEKEGGKELCRTIHDKVIPTGEQKKPRSSATRNRETNKHVAINT